MTEKFLRPKQISALVKWLFTIIALAFILNSVWLSRFLLLETLEQSDFRYLVIALATYLLAHFFPPVLVSTVLGSGTAKIGFKQALDIHFRYLPARYLPGGVWHTVARVNRLHELGVGPRRLTCLLLLENLMATSVALGVGGALLGNSPQGTIWSALTVPVAVASLMCLASLPFALNRWILSEEPGLTFSTYAIATLACLFFWTCMGMAFLSFAAAFPHAAIGGQAIEVVGAYLFAWGIGFIAVFAPQGIGVFEVVAADLLPTSLSFQALVALLAGFRLVSLLGDLSLWSSWLIKRLMQRV